MEVSPVRCGWASGPEILVRYHDTEWGVPVYDDRTLFEFLLLETAQAGLSWMTVLQKRANYAAAFDQFDPARIALYTEADRTRLLGDAGLIRHQAKIRAAVSNAQAYLKIQEAFGSFSHYLWAFVDGAPLQNSYAYQSDVPTSTPLSDRLSRDLRQRGLTFIGTTTCYSYLQAVGLVNDHLVTCFRYADSARKIPH